VISAMGVTLGFAVSLIGSCGLKPNTRLNRRAGAQMAPDRRADRSFRWDSSVRSTRRCAQPTSIQSKAKVMISR